MAEHALMKEALKRRRAHTMGHGHEMHASGGMPGNSDSKELDPKMEAQKDGVAPEVNDGGDADLKGNDDALMAMMAKMMPASGMHAKASALMLNKSKN